MICIMIIFLYDRLDQARKLTFQQNYKNKKDYIVRQDFITTSRFHKTFLTALEQQDHTFIQNLLTTKR